MDETTLVRQLRADMPEPDAAALAAARRRLREAMSGPGRRTRSPGRGLPAAAVPVAAAFAVVALVGGLAAVPRLVDRVAGPASADLAAAAFLEVLAGVAERQPDPGPPGDRVWHRSWVDANVLESSAFQAGPGSSEAVTVRHARRYVREDWTAVAGPVRRSHRPAGEPTGLHPSVRDDDAAAGEDPAGEPARGGRDVLSGPGGFFVGEDMLPWSALLALPPDPAGMRRVLPVDRQWTTGPGDVGELLAGLLEMPLRPGQHAAVLRLLATVPGLVLDGPVEGPEGVRGEAVSIPMRATARRRAAEAYHGGVAQLVFDPATARLVARVNRLVHPDEVHGAPAGAVVGYRIYRPGRYVDAAEVPSDEPAGDARTVSEPQG